MSEKTKKGKVICPACGMEVKDADNCPFCKGTGEIVFP